MGPSRIGFITTSFPRREGDPAGGFVLGMAAALARRGHRVEVIVPEPPGPHEWRGRPGWLRGVAVFPAPYLRPARAQRLFFGAGVPDNLSSNPALWAAVPLAAAGLALAARRRSAAWDAVISHWLLPSALIGGAIRRGAPHLAVAHSGDVHLLGRSHLGGLAARAVLRCADRIGFVSAGLRDEFSGLLGARARRVTGSRLVLAPMGIDPAAMAPSRPREELRARLGLDRFTVLFLGRLVPIKGADILLDAAGGAMRLVVAGDGPLRAELERAAARLGVDARFEGEVGPAERAALMCACDALAVPSRVLADGRHEGLPIVILEAMAAGLTVVAADTGGIGEVVRHG
jgi:glycosyltransferase involved in cell wall biosynthesis